MTVGVGALEAYFDAATARFGDAVAQVGPGPDRGLVIAGHSAHLEFAGPALAARVLPALQHLPECPASAPGLTVRLWDVQSTGVPLPPPPWEELEYSERGGVRAYDDARFSLSFDKRTDVFSAVDDCRDIAVYWTRDASAVPYYESAAPLRQLLQGWFRSKGLFVMHAAAIGRPDAGVLLAGRGGSGKSTTAVLSLVSDLMYASDDFTLVQCEPVPYVYSLYSTAKLNAETFERMPEVRHAVSNAERLGREKGLLFLDTCFRHKLALGFPLCAIAVPRVTGRAETAVTRVSPLAIYRAVAPDTVFRTLGDARSVLRLFNRLVHELPCYDLALGTDRLGIREALHGVLARR